MRLYLLLFGIMVGWWFTATPGLSTVATLTPRPTPTIKACHICDEKIIPAVTPTAAEAAEKGEAVVQAVMFWMDTCPHCHVVLEEVLPPLQQKYGDQLQISLIEVKSEETWNQLVQVGTALGLSPDRLGVPFLVIGDKALIGSGQIPAELPGLIEQHLSAGGVAYPELPSLSEALPTATPTAEAASLPVESCSPAMPCAEETPPRPETATPAPVAQVIADLPADPSPAAPSTIQPTLNGFGLAIGIMVGMVVALAYTGVVAIQGLNSAPSRPAAAWPDGAIPLLALIGLGVAAYLAYVETQAVAAVCGPVGDCNAVQASPYAKLFGILPVGVLGAIGYIAILVAWLWGRFGSGRLADYAPLAMFGMALFGVLFSLYLTYLEPFVIGAVCIWCLTSAVIVLVSKPPALPVADDLLRLARRTDKPVVVDFIGYIPPATKLGNLHFVRTFDETAQLAVELARQGGQPAARPEFDVSQFAPGQKYLRGLFSGGTLAYEALLILQDYLPAVYSNAPLKKGHNVLPNSLKSEAHTIVDLGEDEFTVGRLHPMMDNTLRIQRLFQEAEDPEVAVVMLDVVLGYGSHPDPASELAPAIKEAIARANKAGRRLEVVAVAVGTNEDPQDLEGQIEMLQGAGAKAHTSNDKVVRYVGELAQALAPVTEQLPVAAFQPVDLESMKRPLAGINVGVESFAESLQAQAAAAIHVDWQPPAGGNEKLMNILARMKSSQ